MTEQEQQDSTAEAEETVAAETPEETTAPVEVVAKGGDEVEDGDPMIMPGMNWFVLRVASNKEKYVQTTLLRKIKIENYMHLVNRILVPTEKIKTIKNGKQKITLKMLYPGYVFVEMRLENDGRIPQDVFFLIKETTGVGDFHRHRAAVQAPCRFLKSKGKMQMASKPTRRRNTISTDGLPKRRYDQDQRWSIRKHGRHRRCTTHRKRLGPRDRDDLRQSNTGRTGILVNRQGRRRRVGHPPTHPQDIK